MRTAINLYSVREFDEPMPKLLERVADASYDGVQFSGDLRESSPEEVKGTLDDLGLAVTGAHVGIEDLESDLESTYDAYAETIGTPSVVVPWIGPDHFADADSIDATISRVAAIADAADDYDWPLHYHNHDHEFQHVGGEYPIDRLLDTILTLDFEIDVGWVATGGEDPVEYIERYADRIELVHMKDMATDSGEFREIGHGDVDMSACADAAAAAGAEWLIYEHDEPADPAESIETGAAFLADL
jgi:sugar phosphate isomerase/epimerase